MKRTMLAALAAVVLASCQVNYEKAPSGLVYKIIKGKGGDKVEPGKFVKFNIEYSLPDKDSVINTSYGKLPGYSMVDTSARAAYSFMEILPKCSVGDSAVIMFSVDSLKNRNMLDYNEIFKKGGTIQCVFKVLQVFKTEADVTADYQKEMEAENQKQVKAAEDYAAKKGWKGQKTKSGAIVIIDNPGDVANKADSGKMASVKYRGYLADGGKVFDTNFDSSKGHTDPYNLVVGTRSVIQGWDEALPFFGKGGTGKIVVPAFMGYGSQGAPPEIPANALLVFDISLVDVKDASAAEKNEATNP